MTSKTVPSHAVPSMIEATIGTGGSMEAPSIQAPSIGSLEDVVNAFTDALKVGAQPVVRTAMDDLIAYLATGDMLATATKQQLQGLLRALLSVVAGPSKPFHWSIQVWNTLATAPNAADIGAVLAVGIERTVVKGVTVEHAERYLRLIHAFYAPLFAKIGSTDAFPPLSAKLAPSLCELVATIFYQRDVNAQSRASVTKRLSGFNQLLTGSGLMLDSLAAFVLAPTTPLSPGSIALGSVLVDVMSSIGTGESFQGPFLEFYLRSCVDPTSSVTVVCESAPTTQPFRRLIQTLTHEQFASTVVPILVRGFKAKTVPTLCTVTAMLKSLTFDPSRYVADVFTPVIVANATAVKDDARAAVMPFIRALLSKCSDSDAVSSVTSALLDVITTKRTGVPLWQARYGVADALSAVYESCSSIPQSSSRTIATQLTVGIASVIAKEVHDGTREKTVLCMGQWCSKVDALPDEVKAVFVSGLNQASKTIAEQYLAGITAALASPDVRAQCGDLVPGLVNVVKAASTPVVRPQAVIAACCVVWIAAADATVLESLTKPTIAVKGGGAGGKPTTAAVPTATTGKKVPPAPGKTPATTPTTSTAAGGAGGAVFDFAKLLNHDSSVLFAGTVLEVSGRSGSDVLALKDALVLYATVLPVVFRELRSLCDPFKTFDSVVLTELRGEPAVDALTELTNSVTKITADPPQSASNAALRPMGRAIGGGAGGGGDSIPTKSTKDTGSKPGGKKPTGSGPTTPSTRVGTSGPSSVVPSSAVSVVTESTPRGTSKSACQGIHPLIRAIVALLSHPLRVVRVAASNSVNELVLSCPELGRSLLHALSAVVSDVASLPNPDAFTAIGSHNTWYQFEESQHSPYGEVSVHDAAFVFPSKPFPRYLREALVAIVNANAQVSGGSGEGNGIASTILPQALLLSSNPIVCPTDADAAAVWKALYGKLVVLAGYSNTLTGTRSASGSSFQASTASASCLLQQADVNTYLKNTLFGRCGLWSDVAAYRIASVRAVSLLFRGCEKGKRSVDIAAGAGSGGRAFVLTEVLPKLLQVLRSAPSLTSHITPLEVQIWSAAEGVLYVPPPTGKEDDFIPTVVTSKNVRKERVGKRGGGFDEDEEYLESLSKQLQAQKLASVATTVKSEADVIAIAKQSAIRADVTRINTIVEVPLNVLKALNDVHALALQPLIPVIFPTLLPLVSAVLTRGVVRPLVTSVITTALLGTPLLQLAPKLSRTLITTLAHEGNIVELLDELKFYTRHLCSVCLPSSPLPVPAYVVVLPVLTKIVAANPPLPLLQPVLSLLNIHVTPSRAALSELHRVAESAHGDAIPVVLSESITAQLASSWVTADDVLEATLIVGSYLSVVSSRYSTQDLARLASANETESVASIPFQSQLSKQPPTAIGLLEYLARRTVRDTLSRSLLSAVALSPMGTPSAGDVLLKTVLGGEDAPSVLASFDVCDTGVFLGSGGIQSSQEHVRHTALSCLDVVLTVHADVVVAASAATSVSDAVHSGSGGAGGESTQTEGSLSLCADQLVLGVWLAMHDSSEELAAFADSIWSRSGLELNPAYFGSLQGGLSNAESAVRLASGRAIAGGMYQYQSTAADVVASLFALFDKHATPLALMSKTSWITRHGVLSTLGAAATRHSLPVRCLEDVLNFLIAKGLSDKNGDVSTAALNAGREVMQQYGEEGLGVLLPILEHFVRLGPSSPLASKDDVCQDQQHEGVIVYLGVVAQYLPPTDPKIASTAEILLKALHTPSESVQRACAPCLTGLAKHLKESSATILSRLLSELTTAPQFPVRRGASFGLAGCVKGFGIACLKSSDVMTALEEAAQSKSAEHRQGALFAFETLSESLGLLFEPYVIRILPLLLKGFGDPVDWVRDAAHGASKIIMAKLTSTGVKLVMPSLLKGLQETQWRSKQASITLLGSMAYCAPAQLSILLPQIVPKLCECFADTHPKVQAAAKDALTDVASVIRNPEISAITETIMAALANPAEHTKAALDMLSSTAFVHSIDAPSLAIVAPVLRRGLHDRSTAVKVSACMIIGNICSLVGDTKNIIPYLSSFLGPLKKAVIDPNPDVRRVAARAMGSLVTGVGEEPLEDLLPWLLETMQSDASSVERSGGAQGASEVLRALGEDKLVAVVTQLLPLANHPKSGPREGLLWLLAFLPSAMGEGFATLIDVALPIVLKGLSDDVELVRDVAMRSGQAIVNQHARSHSTVLIPALQNGLFDPSWRIRQSSVELLGSLLYRIAGVKAIVPAEEVDLEAEGEVEAYAPSSALDSIAALITREVRDDVMSFVYMLRCDLAMSVRQSSLQVWKSLVPNTGRALKDILPSLMNNVVSMLASEDPDNITVAGRCLGDIVKKLGERVLPAVVPTLREGLKSSSAEKRQGVCLGLSEVIGSSTKRQLEDFLGLLIEAVQEALCDEEEEVRDAAAKAFNTLQHTVGGRAVDEILPSLLSELTCGVPERANRATYGLKGILSQKSKDVLHYVVPKLLSPPVSASNARALAAVAEVTTGTIHLHFGTIFPAMMNAVASKIDTSGAGSTTVAVSSGTTPEGSSSLQYGELGAAFRALVLAISGPGVYPLLVELGKFTSAIVASHRAISCWLLGEFCKGGDPEEYGEFVPMVAKDLINRLHDEDETTVVNAFTAMDQLVVAVTPENMVEHLDFIRGLLRSVVSDARHRRGAVQHGADFVLRGFVTPAGLAAFVPVFQYGLMNGSEDTRETAALALGELAQHSAPEALKAHLVKITGPLIRIVGDKFPSKVKAAILSTLGIIIDKGGVALRAFLPQLQPTFVKSLSDPNKGVRTRAADCLGKIMAFSPRVDPIVNDLCKGIEGATSAGVQDSMVEALLAVIRFSGSKITQPALMKSVELLQTLMAQPNEAVRRLASTAVGAALSCMEPENQAELVNQLLSVSGGSDAVSSGGGAGGATGPIGKRIALYGALRFSPAVLSGHLVAVADIAVGDATRDTVQLRQVAAGILGMILILTTGPSALELPVRVMSKVVATVVSLLKDTASDVRRSAAKAVKRFGKICPGFGGRMVELVPNLVPLVKDPNTHVKLAAERALMHGLQVLTDEALLKEYLKVADPETGNFLSSYCKRVLQKLDADSESDGEV